MAATGRILILWNEVEEDVYEKLRRDGPVSLDWAPNGVAEEVSTVAEEFALIVQCLRNAGHEVFLVNIGNSVSNLLDAIEDIRPSAIFNFVEFFGEDPAHEMHVAGVFELLGIPYTGNRPDVLALCQKKHRTKAVLQAAGIPTPPYFVVSGRPGDDHVPATHSLRFPLIVKPAMEDASGGIDDDSVVHDPHQLAAKVRQILTEFAMPVLVEEYIDGREVHCAILGNDPPEVLPLFEMEFVEPTDPIAKKLPRIITYKAKWDPHSRDFYAMSGHCPARDLEPEVAAHIQAVALAAYHAVGCRDYARVDMRVDPRTGEAYVLEVNPNPDLSDVCAFVQCAAASGRSYHQVINEIVGFALARRNAEESPPPDQVIATLRKLELRGKHG
jgi:D-alanine-D-alanine ligase